MTARQLNITKDLKQNYIKGIQFRKKIYQIKDTYNSLLNVLKIN